VRLLHRPPGLFVAERVQQADALGRGEDEVEAGDRCQLLHFQRAVAGERVDPLDRDPPRPVVAAQLLLRPRVLAPDQPTQLALLHDAFEPELLGAAASPDAWRLAPARVVVVEAVRDGAFVVALLARRELGDAQHSGPIIASDPLVGRMMHLCPACY
jgi:hypothetical protein